MSEKASSPSPTSVSAQQLRKIKKPIIERRRRERINDSLNQLKALVLDALNKDESRYSKMEKADILEMTVRHLKAVQRQPGVATPQETSQQPQQGGATDLLGKYQAGYQECANEVGRYLGSVQGVGSDVQHRLLSHLTHRFHNANRNSTPAQLPILSTAFQATPTATQAPPTTYQATPTATPFSALPGQLSVNTATSVGSGSHHAATVLTASPSLPAGGDTGRATAPAPVIAVVSPAALTQDSVLRNAIPLYVTPSLPPVSSCKPAMSSPPTCQSIPAATTTTASKHSPRNTGAQSPQLGDDVPEVFQKRKGSFSTSPVAMTTPVKSHSSMYAHSRLPKTELCTSCPVTEYSSKSVWRPW